MERDSKGRFKGRPKLETSCEICNKSIFHYESEPRKTCSRACKAKWWSQQRNPKKVDTSSKVCAICSKVFEREHGRGIRSWRKAKYCSHDCYWKAEKGGHNRETRLKMSLARRGKKNWNWKGGTYGTERHRAMGRMEYKEWRKAVFERDDYSCQECGGRGVFLNADHIKPWAHYPELRYEVDNGRTLCVPCHKNTDTWGYKGRDYTIQLSKER